MFSSDNCFVIISRDKMPWIPYSYKEIYEIKSSGKYHRLERIYEDMEKFKEAEEYITEYLLELTHGKEYQYSKKKINHCYLENCCFRNSFCDGFTTKEKGIVKS